MAKEEEYDSAIAAQMDAMQAIVEQEKAGDLQRHREEVAEMLKGEILTRYYFDRGRIQGTIGTDKVVGAAIKALHSK